MILRVCTGSLAAARKGHSRARRFGTTFTFLVQFSSPAARSASSMQRFIWEGCSGCSSLGASARHACACIVRIESLAGTMLLGILAASGSFGAFLCMTGPLPCSAALVVAALAAMCSAFRLLVCRCTARCWGPVLALCMDRARHFCVTGCALCGARRLRSVQYWVMSTVVESCRVESSGE